MTAFREGIIACAQYGEMKSVIRMLHEDVSIDQSSATTAISQPEVMRTSALSSVKTLLIP